MAIGSVEKYVQTTIRLSPLMIKYLRGKAYDRGYSVKDLFLFVLWDYFEKANLQ